MGADLMPPDGIVTRRHFLRLTGGAALLTASGGLLAACAAT